MSKRLVYLGLLSMFLISGSGCQSICCMHDRWLNHYQGTHWCDCGCGETYYDAWHNYPPDCCDPCDDCGNYVGRKWWVPSFGCCGGSCGPSYDGCGNCGGCWGTACHGGCLSKFFGHHGCGGGCSSCSVSCCDSCGGGCGGGCCGGGGHGGMGPGMYEGGMEMGGETIIQGEEVPVPHSTHSAPHKAYGVPTPAQPPAGVSPMGRRPHNHGPAQNPRMSRRPAQYRPQPMSAPRTSRRMAPMMQEEMEQGPRLGQSRDVFDEMDAADSGARLTQRGRSWSPQRGM